MTPRLNLPTPSLSARQTAQYVKFLGWGLGAHFATLAWKNCHKNGAVFLVRLHSYLISSNYLQYVGLQSWELWGVFLGMSETEAQKTQSLVKFFSYHSCSVPIVIYLPHSQSCIILVHGHCFGWSTCSYLNIVFRMAIFLLFKEVYFILSKLQRSALHGIYFSPSGRWNIKKEKWYCILYRFSGLWR